MKFVIVTGSPIDGFTFIGPFEFHGDASDYADANLAGEADWWIAEVRTP